MYTLTCFIYREQTYGSNKTPLNRGLTIFAFMQYFLLCFSLHLFYPYVYLFATYSLCQKSHIHSIKKFILILFLVLLVCFCSLHWTFSTYSLFLIIFIRSCLCIVLLGYLLALFRCFSIAPRTSTLITRIVARSRRQLRTTTRAPAAKVSALVRSYLIWICAWSTCSHFSAGPHQHRMRRSRRNSSAAYQQFQLSVFCL